jgi:hypothetical protein
VPIAVLADEIVPTPADAERYKERASDEVAEDDGLNMREPIHDGNGVEDGSHQDEAENGSAGNAGSLQFPRDRECSERANGKKTAQEVAANGARPVPDPEPRSNTVSSHHATKYTGGEDPC